MPLKQKVLQVARLELDAKLGELRGEHTKVLAKIAGDPRRYGEHLRSATHGVAIRDEIYKTYRLRRDAIDDCLVRALRFQGEQPFTVEELAEAFHSFYEPERSDALEYSRRRLAEIPYTSFINDVVTESNKLVAAFRGRAEHIVADHAVRDRSKDEKPPAPVPQAVSGTGDVGLSGVGMVAFGSTHTKAAMDVAAESARELERLHKIVRKLSKAELSAYATEALPIRTFLISKGHAFSVLPEKMLAEQFRQELERRKETIRHNVRTFGGIMAIATLAVGAIALVKCSADAPPTKEATQVVAPTVIAPAQATTPTTQEPAHALTPVMKEPDPAATTAKGK